MPSCLCNRFLPDRWRDVREKSFRLFDPHRQFVLRKSAPLPAALPDRLVSSVPCFWAVQLRRWFPESRKQTANRYNDGVYSWESQKRRKTVLQSCIGNRTCAGTFRIMSSSSGRTLRRLLECGTDCSSNPRRWRRCPDGYSLFRSRCTGDCGYRAWRSCTVHAVPDPVQQKHVQTGRQ